MTSERSLKIPAGLGVGRLGASSDFGARFRAMRAVIVQALRSSPALLELVRVGDQVLYKIELPKEAFAGLADGLLSWNVRADGTLPAVIRHASSNEIAHHVSLRAADFSQSTLQGLNGLAIHAALGEIVARLEALKEKVDLLLQHVRTDRQAMVKSGFRLYEQALEMQDSLERRMTLSNAAQSLEEGRSSLIECVDAALSKLSPPTPFKAFLSGTKMTTGTATEKLAGEYGGLCDDVAMVLVATQWLALVYEELSQPGAAHKAIEQLASSVAKWNPAGRKLAEAVPYSREFDPKKIWQLAAQTFTPGASDGLSLGTSVVVEVTSAELLNE